MLEDCSVDASGRQMAVLSVTLKVKSLATLKAKHLATPWSEALESGSDLPWEHSWKVQV